MFITFILRALSVSAGSALIMLAGWVILDLLDQPPGRITLVNLGASFILFMNALGINALDLFGIVVAGGGLWMLRDTKTWGFGFGGFVFIALGVAIILIT